MQIRKCYTLPWMIHSFPCSVRSLGIVPRLSRHSLVLSLLIHSVGHEVRVDEGMNEECKTRDTSEGAM